MNYYFSASLNGFIPAAYKNDGTYTKDTWPGDAILCTDNEEDKYRGQQAPEGKTLGHLKGRPAWVSIPPLTKEQLIEQAEHKKQLLITEANQKTQLWQTQLMLGIITDEDKASLTEWMLYVQKVQAVDTSAAPDIIWPEKPE